jgi:hypothetical protein
MLEQSRARVDNVHNAYTLCVDKVHNAYTPSAAVPCPKAIPTRICQNVYRTAFM